MKVLTIKTFKQGVHLKYHKDLTCDKPLIYAKRPQEVFISLAQHIGAPCQPLVKKGDKVKLGQKIGDSDSFVSAPVHASVSGEVISIENCLLPTGKNALTVRIKADEKDIVFDNIKPYPHLDELKAEEIKEIIKEAGIVGLGGAMFPTHVKLTVPDAKEVEYVILDGAECEPYLTVDHRVMLERSKDVVYGLKAIMKAVGVHNGIIGIEDNKINAIKALEKVVANEPTIDIAVLETKYPQGGEKMLISAILGREVPSGGLPLDIGVIVNNVSTALAIADALQKGMPLIERTVTITGSGINQSCNLIYRIGTTLADLIKDAGGFVNKKGVKIITGGPMMGRAQPHLKIPTIKGSSGIIAMTEKEIKEYEVLPCIKCARCVDVCPLFLMPVELANLSEHEEMEKLEDYHILNCMECGSCSYICPSKRPLLDHIKIGKMEVMAKKKNRE